MASRELLSGESHRDPSSMAGGVDAGLRDVGAHVAPAKQPPSALDRGGAVQLASWGAAAEGAPMRAGDWVMTSDLASAMGMGEAFGAVQRAADLSGSSLGPSSRAGESAQSVAQRGVAGASAALPYADQISSSFGRHDISDVRTATGGAAAEASQSLGAHAYATGNTIAFAKSPDLHLAAHEAAHVVQQRAGVQLADGMGRPGDQYERHADAVADAVVRGESAEALLDQHAGGGSGTRAPAATQLARQVVQRFSADQTPEQRAEEARGVLRALTALPPDQQDARIASWSESWTQELLGAVSDADRTTYGALLARITVARAVVDAAWTDFATAFRSELAGAPELLVQFGGDEITGAQLRRYFTVEQRGKLTAFFGNHQIPERLFNGGEATGGATARQRILLSSHILTTGTYENRGHEQQRVEARNCGHFVSLVNAYAGVGSENGVDVRGNFDHAGDVVLHAGASGRPSFDGDAGLPFAQFDSIQPGDWLYIHMSINHSVIFAGWKTGWRTSRRGEGDDREECRFRTAYTYDQLHNGIGEGGLRHEARLGERPAKTSDGWDYSVYSVTRVEAPRETGVATTADDLLPGGGDLSEEAARNRQGLEDSGITREAALSWVRDQNVELIRTVSARRPAVRRAGDPEGAEAPEGRPRTSPEQVDLLQSANDSADLERLVHLNERLQRLADGIAFLNRAEADDGALRYRSERDPAELHAEHGFHTSSGRRDGFDITGEAATTGRLEQVRNPLAGYTAPRGPVRSTATGSSPASCPLPEE
jgi:Domain of unknown function (DUF4157)